MSGRLTFLIHHLLRSIVLHLKAKANYQAALVGRSTVLPHLHAFRFVAFHHSQTKDIYGSFASSARQYQ